MTAVFILPILFQLAQSDKATNLIALSDAFYYDSIFDYLKILQSAFMIPDGMRFVSLFPDNETVYPYGTLGASLAAYIPLFSSAGVISYIIAKKKSWKSVLTLICVAIAFIPILNHAFSAFNSGYYARWFYMPMLIAIIMSVQALEDGISFKPGIISCSIVLCSFIIYQICTNTSELITKATSKGVFSLTQNILHFSVTALMLIVLIIVVKSKRDREFIPKLYIFTIISCYITFGVMTHYVYSSPPGSDIISDYLCYNEEVPEKFKDGERIITSVENTNQIWQMNSAGHFNSLHDYGHRQFLKYSGLEYSGGIFGNITDDFPALADFASVKYYFSLGKSDKFKEENIVGTMSDYVIYKNPNYIPMGFVYDNTISREKFLEIEDTELRQKTYLKALIVEDPELFSDILPNIDEEAGKEISDKEYELYINKRKAASTYFCEKSSTGLRAKINLETENVVFISASYNENWSASVDGNEAKVYNVNNGLIGIRVPEGDHEITLTYTVRGIDTGLIISVCSIFALITYGFLTLRKGKKNVCQDNVSHPPFTC